MVALVDLGSLQHANELIRAGLRLSIVRGLTGIGTRTLRQWWKDIHGVSPSNGKLPESVLSYIRDRDMAARLSAYAAFHKRLHGSTLTAETLLSTWREFPRFCCPLDINAAYFAARDVKARIVLLSHCRVCNASYIYDAGSKHTDHCPFCDSNEASKVKKIEGGRRPCSTKKSSISTCSQASAVAPPASIAAKRV